MRLFFEFFAGFWKSQIYDFVSKTNFSVKFSQNLSTYSNHEYLQVKNTNFAINASVN